MSMPQTAPSSIEDSFGSGAWDLGPGESPQIQDPGSKTPLLAATHPPALPPGPVVVLDDPARGRDIYGAAFERLGVVPVHANGMPPDEIIARRPALILLSSEWTHEWRLTAAAARKALIPVVYVMDGVLEWSYVWNNLTFIRPWGTMLQPLLASDLCVIGQHQARILSSMGLARRIHVVGLPRLDRVSRERILNHGGKPRIVVATPRTAGHNVEQHVMALRALRDLRTWFAAQDGIELCGVSPPIWRRTSVSSRTSREA